MKKQSVKTEKQLEQLGERIKLARLRRKYSQEIVAKRAGISRPTLTAVEKGVSTVSIGIYAMVMMILGLLDDFGKIANDDLLGRRLQDLDLKPKARSRKKKRNE